MFLTILKEFSKWILSIKYYLVHKALIYLVLGRINTNNLTPAIREIVLEIWTNDLEPIR